MWKVLRFADIDLRHLAGITTNPTGPWTTQADRNLMMRLPDDHTTHIDPTAA